MGKTPGERADRAISQVCGARLISRRDEAKAAIRAAFERAEEAEGKWLELGVASTRLAALHTEASDRADLLDRALRYLAGESSIVPPPYDEDLEQQQMWERMSKEKRTEARVEWALFEARPKGGDDYA